jgi:hypothetical protein
MTVDLDTPWTRALQLPKSDEALSRKLRVAPVARPDLHEHTPKAAGELLDDCLKALFHPSAQDLRVVRTLADIAGAHAVRAYASLDAFVRGAQIKPRVAGDPATLRNEMRLTMLTGPAGVGKSEVAQATAKLLWTETKVCASPGMKPFPIRPIGAFSIGQDLKNASRLNAIAKSIGLEPQASRGDAADMSQLALRLYQWGCCMLIPDEVQFITKTESNAQVTSILLQLGRLGPPVVYVCNYDLGHKLKQRPPQDKARLLSKPIIMLPDPHDDPAFVGLLVDIGEVLAGVVQIDFEEHARQIHSWTFGIRRCVRNLFVVAYVLMRRDKRPASQALRLTIAHLHSAYEHVDYEESKEAVIESRNALNSIGKADSDFRCPFNLPEEQEVQLRREAHRLRQEDLDREREKDARTGEERRRQEQAAREKAATQPKPPQARKPAPGPRRPASAEDWLRQLDSKGKSSSA